MTKKISFKDWRLPSSPTSNYTVYAKRELDPERDRFGPYCLKDPDNAVRWMSLVKQVCHIEDANLIGELKNEKIYFGVKRKIAEKEEFRVWFHREKEKITKTFDGYNDILELATDKLENLNLIGNKIFERKYVLPMKLKLPKSEYVSTLNPTEDKKFLPSIFPEKLPLIISPVNKVLKGSNISEIRFLRYVNPLKMPDKQSQETEKNTTENIKLLPDYVSNFSQFQNSSSHQKSITIKSISELKKQPNMDDILFVDYINSTYNNIAEFSFSATPQENLTQDFIPDDNEDPLCTNNEEAFVDDRPNSPQINCAGYFEEINSSDQNCPNLKEEPDTNESTIQPPDDTPSPAPVVWKVSLEKIKLEEKDIRKDDEDDIRKDDEDSEVAKTDSSKTTSKQVSFDRVLRVRDTHCEPELEKKTGGDNKKEAKRGNQKLTNCRKRRCEKKDVDIEEKKNSKRKKSETNTCELCGATFDLEANLLYHKVMECKKKKADAANSPTEKKDKGKTSKQVKLTFECSKCHTRFKGKEAWHYHIDICRK